MADLRSPLAKARDAWMESEEGKRCVDSNILARPGSEQYLRNRLETAFIAGATWAEAQAKIGQVPNQEGLDGKGD